MLTSTDFQDQTGKDKERYLNVKCQQTQESKNKRKEEY